MLCDENAICTNIYEGYNCDCKKGFKGDGFKCEGKTHGFPLVMLQYFFLLLDTPVPCINFCENITSLSIYVVYEKHL